MRNEFEKYESNYVLKKDWVFPFDAVPPGAKIVLYGAGDVGQAYYHQLKATGYCDIVAWVDKRSETMSKWGFPIVSSDEIGNYYFDYIVVSVSEAVLARSINSILLEHGVSQDKIVWVGRQRETIKTDIESHMISEPIRAMAETVLRYRGIRNTDHEAYKYMAEITDLSRKEGSVILPRLVVELTTVCTLKCEGCNNLMPLYEKPGPSVLDEVLSDIDKIATTVDRIIILELIGGEPFCYPYLGDVLKHILDKGYADEIEITTNGTLIPKDELIPILKDKRICVRISKYEKSYNADKLVRLFQDSQIRHVVMEDLVWTDPGKASEHLDPQDLLIERYYKCPSSKMCKTLHHGKLFPCARAASLYDLGIGKENIEYVDLYSSDLKKKIHSFLRIPYSNACNYCSVTDEWRNLRAGY